MSMFYLLSYHLNKTYASKAGFGTLGITLLIAGWLADTHIGRYKVVRTSIWIMWMAVVIAMINSISAYFSQSHHGINKTVLDITLPIMGVGFGGFLVSIVQFGLDQLHDASTNEIKSFIIWYVWTINFAGILMKLIFACITEMHSIFRLLFVCANLSLAIVLLFTCNHCLIKEPLQQNPLKLVYKVIRYAIRNKYPRQRSAFTYCEDELPSRIDFGKNKYGGPFTTEQVEDVKTFLRFIPLVIVGGTLAGSIFTSNTIRYKLLNDIGISESNNNNIVECYSETSYTNAISFGAAILIPLYEILIYPIFYKCTPRMESQRKVLLGMVALIVKLLTLMAYYNVISRHNSLQMNGPNKTTPCLFETSNSMLSKSFNDKWIAVPDFLSAISSTMLCIGVIELISAQVPFLMKGLMIGITFCSFYVSSALWLAISLPFVHIHSIWGTGTLSCGFWYTLLLTIVDLGIFLLLLILTRWYKKRQRQDVLPNEHFFAERYYSTVN